MPAVPTTAPLSEPPLQLQQEPDPQLVALAAASSDIAAYRPAPDASDRDQMLERMRSLRRALPVLAQEMAAARRQAARLRADNRKLTEQVRQLRASLQAREHKPA
jgi:phage shock protein A